MTYSVGVVYLQSSRDSWCYFVFSPGEVHDNLKVNPRESFYLDIQHWGHNVIVLIRWLNNAGYCMSNQTPFLGFIFSVQNKPFQE